MHFSRILAGHSVSQPAEPGGSLQGLDLLLFSFRIPAIRVSSTVGTHLGYAAGFQKVKGYGPKRPVVVIAAEAHVSV